MSFVFLTGPLASAPLVEVVLGHAPSSRDEVSMNAVHIACYDSAFPMPRIEEGATATASAIEINDPTGFDRLTFFASVLGAHPVPKHADMAGKRVSGILFVTDATASSAAGPGHWAQNWSGIALCAAEEIMGYYARLPAHAVTQRLPMILARAASSAAAKTDQPPRIRNKATSQDITLHQRDTTHEGFFLTRSYDLQHPCFDGSLSPRLQREVFIVADAVIVLPYDPVRDRVLLVEQFRMGPFARGDTYPWVLEPVAGRVDAGESTVEAARRECEEEAGLTLGHLEHVSSHYFSPGASTEYYHCFVALTDLPDGADGFGGLATEHEDIKTHVLSFDAAQDLLTSGEANIGPMILLLLWLERERPRLRALA